MSGAKSTRLKPGPAATDRERARRARLKRDARDLRAQGRTIREIAALLGIGSATALRWVNEGRATGRCADCGTPIGDTGLRCQHCRLLRWTLEAIIDAIRRFKTRTGRWPVARDFNPSQARAQGRTEIAERFYADGDYPYMHTAQREFGSWSAAVAAAKRSRRRVAA